MLQSWSVHTDKYRVLHQLSSLYLHMNTKNAITNRGVFVVFK